MPKYTGYFSSLHSAIESSDLGIRTEPVTTPVKDVYSDEELLDELRKLFSHINTLEKYKELVRIFYEIRESITLRFLYLVFEALVEVEERVWGNSGYHPPLQDIYDKYNYLLLDNYDEFVYNYEKEIIAWTKKEGIFDDDTGYDFINQRNAIYTDYVTLAGEILNADFDSNDSNSGGPAS